MQTFTTRTQAVKYIATTYNWTQADAKRALESIDFKPSPQSEEALLIAMASFAGPALYKRQCLQAAQKAQATIQAKQVEDLSKTYEEMVSDYEEHIKQERSSFINLIQSLYGIAQRFGLRDPWVEALLATYNNYLDNPESNAA
jgi:hypothetical protein